MPVSDLIDDCKNLIVSGIKEDSRVNLPDKVIPKDIEISYTERELFNLLIQGTIKEELTYGFLLVLKVYLSNKQNLKVLNEYAGSHGLNNAYDGLVFYNDFDELSEIRIETYVKGFLLKNIIQRHQVVAYRKMGGGSQTTQKFLIEDGLIRQIGNFGPGFTGPRVGNLITFLKDLHLISEDGKITSEGAIILNDGGSNDNG